VSLENKFAPWKKEESSAAELFNSCLSVVLPIVKEEVGKQLIRLNEGGGLDVAGGYKLTVHPRTGDAKRKLTPDELIKTLQVEIKTCRVRTKDVVDLNEDPNDDDTVANRLLNLDLKLAVVIEFGQDNVDFKLERGGWFSPSIEVAVESLHLELNTRIWWDMARRLLKVGFVEEPVVIWDIELKPMIMGMGLDLPDALEDCALSFAIRKALYHFDIHNPISLDLGPEETNPEAPSTSPYIRLTLTRTRIQTLTLALTLTLTPTLTLAHRLALSLKPYHPNLTQAPT